MEITRRVTSREEEGEWKGKMGEKVQGISINSRYKVEGG